MPFLPVATAADVPVGQGTRVEVGGRGVALFNAGGGRFFACGAVCPHEDGPLAEGWLEGDLVVCPWHGYDFDLTSGRCRVDDDLGIPVYAVRIVDGVVEVDLP
jgi:nitrite reductase/ring-hydroxylating ferredoxin subunit